MAGLAVQDWTPLSARVAGAHFRCFLPVCGNGLSPAPT